MDRFAPNHLLDFSFPFKSDDYVSGHLIDPQPKSHSSAFQELFKILAPSVSFFASFVIANLFHFLSLMLIALAVKKCFNLRNRFQVGRQLFAKFSAFKVLLISYSLMAFLVMQLISNNLSTEKVIVDVSDLMHSEEMIKNTKRRACFLGADTLEFKFLKF